MSAIQKYYEIILKYIVLICIKCMRENIKK